MRNFLSLYFQRHFFLAIIFNVKYDINKLGNIEIWKKMEIVIWLYICFCIIIIYNESYFYIAKTICIIT